MRFRTCEVCQPTSPYWVPIDYKLKANHKHFQSLLISLHNSMRKFLAEFVLCAGRQSIYAHFDSRSMMSSASCGDEHKILPPTVLFNDPHTWPKHWTQSEIEGLLRSNLVNPAAPPNYASLATLFHRNDFKSLALLVRKYTKTPAPSEVDLEQNLRDNLNNVFDSAAMPLLERSNQLDTLDIALSPESEGSLGGHHEGDNTVPVQNPSRRNVVCCTSPRGSGKTQFIKRFVFAKRAAAMQCGRVIVRCCDKTAHHTTSASKRSWVTQVLDDRETTSSNLEKRQHLQSLAEESYYLHARSTIAALCELIRVHVEAVTGTPQDLSKYCDPTTAYATWTHETAKYFKIAPNTKYMDPLIILDTCELLAEHDHKSLTHTTGAPYTLLETFCLAVPALYSIFVIGCNAVIGSKDPAYLAMANVTDIGPLVPLSERGYEKALSESWKYEADAALRAPLHHLAGGVPRLLRLAFMKQPQSMSLASGSITALPRCFEVYSAAARAQYPVQPAWFPQAYTCLLASSTKAKVEGSDIIPVNPAWKYIKADEEWDSRHALTYDEAAMMSMGTYNPQTNRFMVPPITFGDTQAAMKPGAPILPSQLHPFLSAEAITRPMNTSTGRQKFSHLFLYAVYARYLLAFWENTSSPWVPLTKTFEGAVHSDQVALLEEYEMNLSSGVKVVGQSHSTENAVTYLEGNDSPKAFIWCRQKHGRNSEHFAVPLHLHKEPNALTNNATKEILPFVLSLHQNDVVTHQELCRSRAHKSTILVEPDAMCSGSRLWLDSYG